MPSTDMSMKARPKPKKTRILFGHKSVHKSERRTKSVPICEHSLMPHLEVVGSLAGKLGCSQKI